MAETCGPPVSHLILPGFTLEQLWVAHASTDLGPTKDAHTVLNLHRGLLWLHLQGSSPGFRYSLRAGAVSQLPFNPEFNAMPECNWCSIH